jgi:hypothetical protein
MKKTMQRLVTDIAPTVVEALSIEHQYAGKNLFDTANTQLRTRYFYKFEPNRVAALKQDKVDEVTRYEINGSIFDLDSWCQPDLDSCR